MDKVHIPVKGTRSTTVHLSCSFLGAAPGNSSVPSTLTVFLNGIDAPQALWYPLVKTLQKRYGIKDFPPVLLFDRPGQGTTTDRNADTLGRPKGHGRDLRDAVQDLNELLLTFTATYLGITNVQFGELRLILVANSAGCAIARLYAMVYPGTVDALLLLDSIPTNDDINNFFPDPDSERFDEHGLLKLGITRDMCRQSRKIILELYGSQAANREGLWRGTLPDPLARADEPKLVGNRGTNGPFVTVVGHDPAVFPAQAEKLIKLPGIMTKTYFDPAWQAFNEGLVTITSPEKRKGPIIAKGAGHYIMKETPEIVADELLELWAKLGPQLGGREGIASRL